MYQYTIFECTSFRAKFATQYLFFFNLVFKNDRHMPKAVYEKLLVAREPVDLFGVQNYLKVCEVSVILFNMPAQYKT